MKILIVGGGGREHAIAWKLRQDDVSAELVAAPGNPGIAAVARCVPVAVSDTVGLVALARAEQPDLVVVGPETPLADGLCDQLRSHGIVCFGPSRAAAQIESSKQFAKQLMLGAHVPTAAATTHSDVESAKRAARSLGAPVVIKASGLAAGKGVIVCGSIPEADHAIERMLRDSALGAAGSQVLVEEFMEGEELSVFFITDGVNFLPMLPAQDHKRLGEHDTGPNTGGMGAYCPVSLSSQSLVAEIGAQIVAPMLAALRDLGTPFSGLLYAGLMLTDSGPKVVEFNCRFGDPETEAVLPLMESRLAPLLLAASESGGLSTAGEIAFSRSTAVTTILASPGYPDKPIVGAPITLSDAPEGCLIFHAGSKRDDKGVLRTSGGRVFAVTGVAPDLGEARRLSELGIRSIHFDGAYFRRDIAWRELARNARAT